MKDLRDQLSSHFKQPAPTAAAAPAAADPLGPRAHLGSDWIALLRKLGPSMKLAVKPDISLHAAQQVTDRTLKALKAAGRKRDRSDLDKARSGYNGKREKIAWARLKEDLTGRGGSQKAYRALKQSKVAPEQALKKLARLDEDLSAMGATRLRDALL
ncbi:MAG: hypothetical protein ACI8S6_002700 [Myxococcota bacterium]|jgi:hypothetical protein